VVTLGYFRDAIASEFRLDDAGGRADDPYGSALVAMDAFSRACGMVRISSAAPSEMLIGALIG
jgi:hypothetical protein